MGPFTPVRYDQLLDELYLHLPGCSKTLIKGTLIKALRVLCDRTEAWTETLAPVDLVAEQLDYTLTTDWQAYIKRVIQVRKMSADEAAAGFDGSITAPQFYDFTPPGTLTLNQQLIPRENVTGGMIVKVVLSPLWNAVEIPDWLFNRWAQGIVARTLFELKAMKSSASSPVPWSDPDGAAFYRTEYNQLLGEIMGDTARGYTTGGGLRA